MKKKWRHVRDNFIREVNHTRTGIVPAKKKKKYVYADALTFLLDFAEANPYSGDISVDTSAQDDLDENETTEVNFCEVKEENVEEDVSAGSSLENPREPNNRRIRSSDKKILEPKDQPKPSQEKIREQKPETRRLSSFQNLLLKKLDNSCEEDCDRMFLLSLLPDLKELHPDEKLEFKLMNLQFFRIVHQRRVHPGPAEARQPQPWIQVNFPLPGVSGAPGASHQYYPTQVPAQPSTSQSTQTSHLPPTSTSPNKQSCGNRTSDISDC